MYIQIIVNYLCIYINASETVTLTMTIIHKADVNCLEEIMSHMWEARHQGTESLKCVTAALPHC